MKLLTTLVLCRLRGMMECTQYSIIPLFHYSLRGVGATLRAGGQLCAKRTKFKRFDNLAKSTASLLDYNSHTTTNEAKEMIVGEQSHEANVSPWVRDLKFIKDCIKQVLKAGGFSDLEPLVPRIRRLD